MGLVWYCLEIQHHPELAETLHLAVALYSKGKPL